MFIKIREGFIININLITSISYSVGGENYHVEFSDRTRINITKEEFKTLRLEMQKRGILNEK